MYDILFDTAYLQLAYLISKTDPTLLPETADVHPHVFVPKGFYYTFPRHDVHTAVNKAFITLFEQNGYAVKLEQAQSYKNVAGRIDAVAENNSTVCSFEFDTGTHIKKKSIEKIVNLYQDLTQRKNYYGFLCIRGSSTFDKDAFTETIKRINAVKPPKEINLYVIYLSSNYITKYKRER